MFDEIILDVVKRRNIDLVLNLAAGLDARPWRLPLPSSLRWVDVDLPAMLDYKAGIMGDAKPVCRYEALRANLVNANERAAVFSRLGAESTTVLVVTEGLLIYLTDPQVADLARELHAQPSFRWWLFDLASPRLLKMLAKSWGKKLAEGNAPFQFAPPNGTAFFSPFGWRELIYKSSLEEAHRTRPRDDDDVVLAIAEPDVAAGAAGGGAADVGLRRPRTSRRRVMGTRHRWMVHLGRSGTMLVFA